MNSYNNEPMIYLAAPFMDINPAVRQERYEKVTKLAAQIIKSGLLVYSPLTYTVPMWTDYNITPPNGWLEFDMPFLQRCQSLMVYTLPGWRESIGVNREIEEAEKWGIPVYKITIVNENPFSFIYTDWRSDE